MACDASTGRYTRLRPAGIARRTLLRGVLAGGAALAAGACVLPAQGKAVQLPAPGPRDTCPVCGMFVAPYPLWVATVVWRDGRAVHFDGAKDFFKYLFELAKYEPKRSRADIVAMGVTDYYNTLRIDAQGAWYVVGSDVLGPMGHELVPHDSEADAREFLADHKGRRLLRFAEVAATLPAALDNGRFQ